MVKNHYLCAHYNSADLSLLSDFDEFKNDLNIVNKSFVTLGKALRIYNTSLYIRDTILLSPVGMGSLDKLSTLYDGDFSKLKVSQEDLGQMRTFLERDKAAFEAYAIRDALIVLKHATAMEVFNMGIKQLGVPLTLSSIGRNYVFEEWRMNFKKFMPYQISGKVAMGNVDEVQTPKGLFETGAVGLHMSYFIGNYKGGRNESFMYGSENEVHWYDYDLSSAYTTALAHLSLPDYPRGCLIDTNALKDLKDIDLLRGYLIVNARFNFPKNVKYPSIACYVDETTTVYPLTGECLVTGPEYLLALNQGCEFTIKSAFYIPPVEIEVVKGSDWSEERDKECLRPFHELIKEIQRLRRENPKGSIMNLLYKEMGNSIYGNVVRGMSNKKSFDTLTGKFMRMKATELSNPILAS